MLSASLVFSLTDFASLLSDIFGVSFVFSFIDLSPCLPRVQDMISQVKKRPDVNLIDYNYSTKIIDEDTDISYFEITRH